MKKTIQILVLIMVCSCSFNAGLSQNTGTNNLDNKTTHMEINESNLKIGSFYIVNDSNKLGFILSNILNESNTTYYSFSPVFYDDVRIDSNEIKNGKIFITQTPNIGSKSKVKGLPSIEYSKSELEDFMKHLNYYGHLEIKAEYLNQLSGGTGGLSYDRLLIFLKNWNMIFGANGTETTLSEIIK